MYDLIPMEIAASGMQAERLRMGVTASNLANARSTRDSIDGGAYQRRSVVFRAGQMPAFENLLTQARNETGLSLGEDSSQWLFEQHVRGVEVPRIEKSAVFRKEFDETGRHPDRDAEGFVTYPDINVMSEMTDMLSASRGYEANLAVIKNTRDMITQLLELLRN
ncbi:flagellar basal body rod protein FlgC [bacterium]|nr:flagellar basal body rod protein FlgC [bacterium]